MDFCERNKSVFDSTNRINSSRREGQNVFNSNLTNTSDAGNTNRTQNLGLWTFVSETKVFLIKQIELIPQGEKVKLF